jgi:citrate synthase
MTFSPHRSSLGVPLRLHSIAWSSILIDIINMWREMTVLINAAEAVLRLGVGRQTLYAYVSRGQIRATSDPADPRKSLYRADDVQRLVERKARGRTPEKVAQSTLDWGLPVLDSAITLIRDGRLFYRGRDVVDLARTATLEAAARLLWDTGEIDPFDETQADLPKFSTGMLANLFGLSPVERGITALTFVEAASLGTWARGVAPLWAESAKLVRILAGAVVGMQPSTVPVHRMLAEAWRLPPADADKLRTILVLCADHELNASTFTVRCIASTYASMPAALMGGLAALSGPLHGGMTTQVEALFDEIARVGDPKSVITARMQRGDYLPGFGHPLYPDGDPRNRMLVDLLPKNDPHREILKVVERLGGHFPVLDFGLVALTRSMGLPNGTGFTLFAIGRSVGWIAHALEQRTQPGLIRPRARYIGPTPVG